VLLCVDRFSIDILPVPRRRSSSGPPIVLVVPQISEKELAEAIRCGVVAVLPRTVTAERLSRSVSCAAEPAAGPSDRVRDLRREFQELQKSAFAAGPGDFTAREVEVLRMMADGLDNGDIARTLNYSERTVKHIVLRILRRLNLHNRLHAVAYALRTGVI
jgi:DNA-binding NarL/FixJ family response regulator